MSLPLPLERLWLRTLPLVAQDIRWVDVDGHRVYGSTHHHRFLCRLVRGTVEPYTVELFRQAIRPGMVVLDLGAFVGYFSLLAARAIRPGGRGYAFECDRRNSRFLAHNLLLNDCRNVELVEKAVADRVGVLPFYVRRRAASRSSLWHWTGKGHTVEVECTTIDAVTGGRPIDVAKIDIEGGELRALKGMEETVGASPKLTMFVECNPDALASAGGSAEKLVADLERLGFRVQAIDESRRMLGPVEEGLARLRPPDSKKSSFNLLCTKGS
jgi:FkbM family methyltransferase